MKSLESFYSWIARPPTFLITLVLGVALAQAARAGELRGIYRNNLGVSRFASERHEEAFQDFSDAMVDLPFAASVHYNLGDAFLLKKDYEKALSEFRQAAKLAQASPETEAAGEIRFLARFNAAIAATELKLIDLALEQYQMALEVRPDSIEVKTNIELLLQKQGQGGENDSQEDQPSNQNGEGQPNKGQGEQRNPENSQNQAPQPHKKDKESEDRTKRPFKSEELSQKDVRRILEELKRQEEQIRAKTQREGAKSVPRDKDW